MTIIIVGFVVLIAFMWLVPSRRNTKHGFDWSKKHTPWSRRRARSAFRH